MGHQRTILFIFLSLLLSSISARADTVRTVLVDEVVINKPIEDVFNYATTADNWKQWHPNTFGAEGASDHSATEGEQIVELIKVGRIRVGKLFWIVTQHVEPSLWQISGVDHTGAAQFLITYTLETTEDNATHFKRELIYDLDKRPGSAFFNATFLKPYMRATSTRAVKKFKAVQEAAPIESTDVQGSI